jgi:hypothetical protein
MAKYMILIYGVEEQWNTMSEEQTKALYAGHAAFRDTAGAKILGGEQLEMSATATALRTDGRSGVSITDGPFLETKEALGGFYLVEAADLDEVTALAARLPEVHDGHSGVEIRPVVHHG